MCVCYLINITYIHSIGYCQTKGMRCIIASPKNMACAQVPYRPICLFETASAASQGNYKGMLSDTFTFQQDSAQNTGLQRVEPCDARFHLRRSEPQLSRLQNWGVMQQSVYKTKIDDLWKHIQQTWHYFEQGVSVIDWHDRLKSRVQCMCLWQAF